MFYVLFKKVVEKINEYDKCAKNPFEKDCSTYRKTIRFKDRGKNKPAKTYVWIDKDD